MSARPSIKFGHPGAAVPQTTANQYKPRALDNWADRPSVELKFIRQGKPVEPVIPEACRGYVRAEGLNVQQFPARADAQVIIEVGRCDHHQFRLVSSLGFPAQHDFVSQRLHNRSPEHSSASVRICPGPVPTSVQVAVAKPAILEMEIHVTYVSCLESTYVEKLVRCSRKNGMANNGRILGIHDGG